MSPNLIDNGIKVPVILKPFYRIIGNSQLNIKWFLKVHTII